MIPTGARQAAKSLPRATTLVAQRPNMSINVGIAAAVVAVGAYGLYLKRNSTVKADDGKNSSSTVVEKKAFGGFPPLKSLKLHSSEMVSHNVKKLRFEFPDKDAVSGLSLTSATLTISFPNGGWKPVPRPYTPVSDLDQKGYIDYMIKQYPGGQASTHMHSLKPGDSIYFMPIPGYKWTPNKHGHVALVAGGAGITPMYQLTKGILSDPADRTRITLVWGVNEDRDLFLADEFDRMERENPGRFRAVYTVSKPDEGSRRNRGYITRQLLLEAGVAPSKGGEKGGEDLKVLVCGPPSMEASLVGKNRAGNGGILGELGFQKGQIHRF